MNELEQKMRLKCLRLALGVFEEDGKVNPDEVTRAAESFFRYVTEGPKPVGENLKVVAGQK